MSIKKCERNYFRSSYLIRITLNPLNSPVFYRFSYSYWRTTPICIFKMPPASGGRLKLWWSYVDNRVCSPHHIIEDDSNLKILWIAWSYKISKNSSYSSFTYSLLATLEIRWLLCCMNLNLDITCQINCHFCHITSTML